jgi:tyrosinase
VCEDAASYCGIRDQAYPDRRAMGYPFDRIPRPTSTSTEEFSSPVSIQEFLTPNMAIGDVTIRFSDRIEDPHLEKQTQTL